MSQRSKIVLSILVIALIVPAVFWIKNYKASNPGFPGVSDVTPRRFISSDVQSESPITDIPNSLKFLVPPGAEEVVMKKVVYKDFKSGFNVDFKYDSSLISPPSTYMSDNFNSNSNWTPLNVQTDGKSSTFIFEARNDEYIVKLTETKISSSSPNIQVSINIIEI